MPRVFNLTKCAAAVGAMCLLSSAANAAPGNQGFESGLTGWTSTGDVSTTGSTTVTTFDSTVWTINAFGTTMAQLNSNPIGVSALDSFFGLAAGSINSAVFPGVGGVTNGAAVMQVFSGNAGDVVTQYWDFVARDYLPFNDTAFVVVDGNITLLASIGNGGIAVGTSGHSGWQSFSFTLSTTGTHSLGFGVVNTGDQVLDAALFLDSGAGTCDPACPPPVGVVPEPETYAMLLAGLGLLGFAARRRKRKEAAAA